MTGRHSAAGEPLAFGTPIHDRLIWDGFLASYWARTNDWILNGYNPAWRADGELIIPASLAPATFRREPAHPPITVEELLTADWPSSTSSHVTP